MSLQNPDKSEKNPLTPELIEAALRNSSVGKAAADAINWRLKEISRLAALQVPKPAPTPVAESSTETYRPPELEVDYNNPEVIAAIIGNQR